MKKLLIFICSALALAFVADRVLALCVDWIYRQSKATDAYKINQTVREVKSDVLFMGSSRCHHNYVPSIISDSIGRSVYNAGLWGMMNIYYQYGLLQLMLDRYTPKVICYEVHPIDILATPYSDVERLNILSPFIGKNHELDSLFRKAGTYSYFRLSHLYRHNGKLMDYLAGTFFVDNSQSDNGYKPLYMQVKEGEMTDEFNFPVESGKFQLFNQFIDTCQSRGIRLIFISSPMYNRSASTLRQFERFDSIAQSRGLTFLDYTELQPYCDSTALFADRGHFNDTGARFYSKMVGGELKKILAE